MLTASEPTTDIGEYRRTVTVKNTTGLHARPAASIVRIGNKYPSVDLKIALGDEEANAKSIMGVMMLAAGNGSKPEFIATGARSQALTLLDELEAVFNNKFGEN
ncbi:MAG: HPr family phosphocarrier protein [Puniceicoccales bacterium]|jgi:phosphocarrier protein|nr:HPr family phosphocarrier protein [Puniceicoccales bacterium]